MLKLVLDTNVIISGFFWKGNEYRLLQLIEERKVEWLISKEILEEIESVIKRPKFNLTIIKAGITTKEIIKKIKELSTTIPKSKAKITICRDKKDNKFLETAKEGKTSHIISGDEDLLVLKKFENIKIIRAKEALEKIL